MNENTPPPPQIIATQRPESGTATALAVVSIIFGTIGLLGSFIPCLGTAAIFVAIPAALCGAGATYIAKTKGSSIGLPVASLVVSLLGVIISGIQIMAINAVFSAADDGIKALDEELQRDRKALQEQIQDANQ